MGHPFETEIRTVSENGGENGVFGVDWFARTQISEGMRKAGAAADFVQKLGDANAGHQLVEGSVETLGFRQRDRLQRRYVEDFISKDNSSEALMV
jgi:hypothetical protein